MCNDCNSCNTGSRCNEYNLPLITSAFFILTEQCNLACTYCFVKQNPKQMTLETAKKALDFLVNNAKQANEIPTVNFFGGEPMLKFEEIIKPLMIYAEEAYDIDVKWSITSNGTLFTEEILHYFKEKEVGILLSLDGCEQSHDANRIYHNGQGSFSRINHILDTYLALNDRATLRATIERNTVDYFIDNIMFGLEKPFHNIFFIPNSFVEWSTEEKENLRLQVRKFGDLFIEYIRNGRTIPLSPFEDKIREIVRINNAIDNPLKINYKAKCGLGGNKFASIGTDGVIYGCQEMTSNKNNEIFIIGNIFTGVDDSLRANLIETFDVSKLAKYDKCNSCKLQPICNGGCVANNYMQTGDMTQQADIICFWEQILLEEAIRVTTILGAEKNEFFRHTYFRKR